MKISKFKDNIVRERELTTRNCNNDDIPMLIQFQKDCINTLSDPSVWGAFKEDEWQEVMQGQCELIACFDENRLAGFIVLNIPQNTEGIEEYELNLSKEQLQHVALLDGVMVYKDYWGNKLQLQLIQLFEDRARAKNKKYISATVSPDNKYSLDNFEEAGYKIVGEKIMHNGNRYIIFKEL